METVYNAAAFEGILIRQKDAIVHLLGEGKFEQALDRLDALEELWVEFDYEYKLLELRRACQVQMAEV